MSEHIEPGMLEWLNEKLTLAEAALRAREQAEQCWRGGDEKSWAMTAKLIGAKPMSKKARLNVADKEKSIAVKCRREVQMFRALIEMHQDNPLAARP